MNVERLWEDSAGLVEKTVSLNRGFMFPSYI
jgi:hypothetical protein